MLFGTSHISSAPKRHVPSGYCIGRHRFIRESCVRAPGDSLTVPTKGQVAYAQAERARLLLVPNGSHSSSPNRTVPERMGFYVAPD